MRIALGADPASIDPRFLADDEGDLVVDAVFDSLVALDENNRPVPAAARRWELSEDRTRYRFDLREGATFHDGSPVTAGDFVRAFRRVADGTAQPMSFGSYRLSPVQGYAAAQATGEPLSGVVAVDERTLEIRLSEPNAEFLAVLADPGLGPVPAVAEEEPNLFGEQPVGNGPFSLSQPWQPGQFIRLQRFEDHAQPALLDEIVFQIYPDDPSSARQYSDFEDGGLDVSGVPPIKLEETAATYGTSSDGYEGPGLLDGITSTIYFYGFNLKRPPFDRAEVRRAVSLAIDREHIAQDIMLGTRVAADSIVPPSLPGAQDGACAHCRYAPDEARALIESLEPPFQVEEPIRLLHNSGRTHRAIAEEIAGALRTLFDAEVEVVGKDLQPFVQDLRAGEMQLFRFGWQADHPSMGAYLDPLFNSENLGEDNLVRYSVPEVDALLEEASRTGDEQTRIDLWRQVEARVLQDVAIAPVMFYRHTTVVASDVRDLRIGPTGRADLSRVWLDRSA